MIFVQYRTAIICRFLSNRQDFDFLSPTVKFRTAIPTYTKKFCLAGLSLRKPIELPDLSFRVILLCGEMQTLSRTYSDSFVTGMGEYDLFKNKNIDWMSGKFTKMCYVLFVLAVWFLLHISSFFTVEDSWTLTNVVHLVVSV